MSLKYSKEHQWIDARDPQRATVGITPHAQETLGDIVFVELPEVGATLPQGAAAAVVESVKAAADVFMPVAGEVVEVNEALRDDPALANGDPTGAGWFYRLRLTEPAQLDQLLDEAAYRSGLPPA